jgi:hypothetical protein
MKKIKIDILDFNDDRIFRIEEKINEIIDHVNSNRWVCKDCDISKDVTPRCSCCHKQMEKCDGEGKCI